MIYNYVRALWSNGPFTLHDAPPVIAARIEHLIRKLPADEREIQLVHDEQQELSIAWVCRAVSLSTNPGTCYRTARYLHAIAITDDDVEKITRRRALELFQTRYGERVAIGIDVAQECLEQLVHPHHADEAAALFITRPAGGRVVRPGAESAARALPNLHHERRDRRERRARRQRLNGIQGASMNSLLSSRSQGTIPS